MSLNIIDDGIELGPWGQQGKFFSNLRKIKTNWFIVLSYSTTHVCHTSEVSLQQNFTVDTNLSQLSLIRLYVDSVERLEFWQLACNVYIWFTQAVKWRHAVKPNCTMLTQTAKQKSKQTLSSVSECSLKNQTKNRPKTKWHFSSHFPPLGVLQAPPTRPVLAIRSQFGRRRRRHVCHGRDWFCLVILLLLGRDWRKKSKPRKISMKNCKYSRAPRTLTSTLSGWPHWQLQNLRRVPSPIWWGIAIFSRTNTVTDRRRRLENDLMALCDHIFVDKV